MAKPRSKARKAHPRARSAAQAKTKTEQSHPETSMKKPARRFRPAPSARPATLRPPTSRPCRRRRPTRTSTCARDAGAGRAPDDQPGRARQRRPEFAEGRRRGPTLLEDFHLREKITHFDHERIPERVVHARGAAAHGVFQVYEDLADLTMAGAPAGPVGADAGLRPLLDRGRLARLDRHAARRARLRGQVLHRRGHLGPRRQQHAGLLHPGRHQVSRPDPRGEARAATTRFRRRRRRTTRSGTSSR